MDIDDTLQLDTIQEDGNRESSDRRDCAEGNRITYSNEVSADTDDYQSPWADSRGRERLAQAMYEC